MLVGTHDQQIKVPTYEWSEHLHAKLKFKTIPNITDYHHFRMSSKEKGIVYCSKTLRGETVRIPIIENISAVTDELPAVVPPRGFTRQRKEYLYTDIREFCTEETKDLTAPDPDKY